MIPFLGTKHRVVKEPNSFGLDIGSQAIKLVKLSFLKETVELCGFALEPSETGLLPAIKRIIESHNVKRINLSISAPAVVIRYINFPRMNNEELKQALKFEAPKYIPFSIDEINLDSYILKEDLPDNKMLVLLAAAKKEFINQRLKMIEDTGLKVNLIDIDSLALINAFNFNYPIDDSDLKNKAIALINIGASVSNLNILENGIPRLSRDIHIAGNNFTQKIVDTLGLDFKSAENSKLNPDKETIEKIISSIESVLTNLASETRTSFDYYESQSASTVAKIFLSGGGSQIKGLNDMLANLLGIEVQYWDSLNKINIASHIDSGQLKPKSSQLAVGVGLALRQ